MKKDPNITLRHGSPLVVREIICLQIQIPIQIKIQKQMKIQDPTHQYYTAAWLDTCSERKYFAVSNAEILANIPEEISEEILEEMF